MKRAKPLFISNYATEEERATINFYKREIELLWEYKNKNRINRDALRNSVNSTLLKVQNRAYKMLREQLHELIRLIRSILRSIWLTKEQKFRRAYSTPLSNLS